MCSFKKGISSNQLHRMFEITYKFAWFMTHRIRYAMELNTIQEKLNGIVEVDETYIGGKLQGKRGVVLKTKSLLLPSTKGWYSKK